MRAAQTTAEIQPEDKGNFSQKTKTSTGQHVRAGCAETHRLMLSAIHREGEREHVVSLGGTFGCSSLLGRSKVSYSTSPLGTESYLPDSGSDLAFRSLLQGYSYNLFFL